MDDKNQKRFLVQGVEKNNHFSNCFINSTLTDGRLMAMNDKYLALAYLGKGNIKLLDSSQPINLINHYSNIQIEESYILDMEFSPFDSNILCFCNENNHVFLSKINYKAADNIEFNSSAYAGHEKKVNFINFNPIASNIMVSGTSYGDIHIWESKEFKTYMQFKLAYNPSTILWSPNGDLIGITQKNKILTIYESRSQNTIFQEQITHNNLITKFTWVDNNIVATIGFNKENKKVLSLLDIRKGDKYQYNNNVFSTIEINRFNSMTVPFVNPELKLIYCVEKEENSIKVFDYCNGSLKKNNEFNSSELNNFSVILNRQYLNKSKIEVDRFARYTKNRNIFYVSFNFGPGQNFSGILYPSEEFAKPQMNSNEWINGKKIEKIPVKLYHKKSFQNINNKFPIQDNEQKEKDNPKNSYLHKFLNQEKKEGNSKYQSSTSKQSGSHNTQNVDYSNLNNELEKENKSLQSKLKDLQNLLKVNENEKENLSKQLETGENKNNINKLEINKYKEIIQEKDIKIQDLENDYKQKEEQALKKIAKLKTEINEKKLLIQEKEKTIQELKNDYRQKEETSLKNIEILKSQIKPNNINIKIFFIRKNIKKNNFNFFMKDILVQ